MKRYQVFSGEVFFEAFDTEREARAYMAMCRCMYGRMNVRLVVGN